MSLRINGEESLLLNRIKLIYLFPVTLFCVVLWCLFNGSLEAYYEWKEDMIGAWYIPLMNNDEEVED